MNFRLALTMMIAAPLASIALAQQYPVPPSTRPPVPTAQPATSPPPASPEPSAQAAAVPGMPSVPANNCVAPEYPGKQASNEKIKTFNTAYAAYGDCIRKYVDNVRQLRDAAMAKGNDAVTEYNKYTEEIKKQLDAEK